MWGKVRVSYSWLLAKHINNSILFGVAIDVEMKESTKIWVFDSEPGPLYLLISLQY